MGMQQRKRIESPRTAEPPPPPETELEKGSKIIKDGKLHFEVDNLKKSKKQVDLLVDQLGAYYENEQYSAYGNRNSYSLKIRVPNVKFDTLITALENGSGKLLSKNISARDVTEEYVDINIRLQNNTAYLEQYQQLLKKANSIKDILEIQEKIRRIEEEIDSRKGRLKFLDDQVKYSTINLELTEYRIAQPGNNRFIKRIANAFQNGFQSFLSFIVGLVHLWPYLILIGLLWFGRKRIFSLFKRKK